MCGRRSREGLKPKDKKTNEDKNKHKHQLGKPMWKDLMTENNCDAQVASFC